MGQCLSELSDSPECSPMPTRKVLFGARQTSIWENELLLEGVQRPFHSLAHQPTSHSGDKGSARKLHILGSIPTTVTTYQRSVCPCSPYHPSPTYWAPCAVSEAPSPHAPSRTVICPTDPVMPKEATESPCAAQSSGPRDRSPSEDLHYHSPSP